MAGVGRGEILLIDKPYGWTSTRAVEWVKRRFRCRKAGHAGTLDPLATGLLIIGTEAQTKALTHLMTLPKEYYALIRLGYRTESDDAEFAPQRVGEAPRLSLAEWEAVLSDFQGEIWQRPPAYAALKVQGKRAYALARAGEAADLPSRPVVVYRLEVVRYDPPERVLLRIGCGKGFYVRSLARDIGEKLGCGGYLAALRRTAIGPYTVSQAIQPDAGRP
jgi:tRNA pseudouridine55 synthase